LKKNKFIPNKKLTVILLITIQLVWSGWGFFAHKKINELAVYLLPTELFGFFKANIDYLSEHAPDPDKRRYMIAEEGPRHFLDLDHYEQQLPIDTLPRNWDSAVAMFTIDTLFKHGIVPWHIEKMVRRLTYAFKDNEPYKIMRYANDLGHYVGDLNVPLHTTGNYNGQKTNQHGIHGLWESRLPELFAFDYNFVLDKAAYLQDPQEAIWQAIERSHSLVDSVLSVEKRVSQTMSEEQKYSFEQRGNSTVKVYSKKFSTAYHKALGPMVEKQMQYAIKLLADLWYTAWVDAGQPILSTTKITQPLAELKEKEAVEKSYKSQEIIGRPEPNE
jgi:hypothetical protein